jgi:predicted nucleic acid-binding Zn ribbon protein
VRQERKNHRGDSSQGGNSLGESITEYLYGQGLEELQILAKIRVLWADVVGEQVAQHAQPESLRDGELWVTVDQPAWATELRFVANDIISKLDEQLASVSVSALKVHVRA